MALLISPVMRDSAAQPAATVLSWITIEATASGVTVAGHALGISDARVEARMTIDREGAAGQSSTSQSVRLDLSAGETAEVARSGLSFGAGDRIEVELQIRQGSELISTSILRGGSGNS